jgi:hypothetical protein
MKMLGRYTVREASPYGIGETTAAPTTENRSWVDILKDSGWIENWDNWQVPTDDPNLKPTVDDMRQRRAELEPDKDKSGIAITITLTLAAAGFMVWFVSRRPKNRKRRK